MAAPLLPETPNPLIARCPQRMYEDLPRVGNLKTVFIYLFSSDEHLLQSRVGFLRKVYNDNHLLRYKEKKASVSLVVFF